MVAGATEDEGIMRYTTLGSRGPRVSRLGFGCMRLPMGTDGKVDRKLAIPMLQRAVDLGVTYFDTAVFYCHGDSQRAVGEALEGVRDRIVLSTKNHLHDATPEEWWARLEESLQLLRTDHLDVYNFHGLTWETFQQDIGRPGGKLELMRRAKAEGKVRHICCSFHDEPDALVKLAETGAFDAITVQYNLLNRMLEAGIHRCRELGVGVVVMGPVGGGRLGVESRRIRELSGGDAASTPEAALRFVLAHPGVNVALSGMSSLEMLEENVRIVSEKEPFTPAQIAAMEREMERVKALQGVNCPACGYCQPCPFGVNIPENFRIYNEYKLYGLTDAARKAYGALVKSAASCVECGACLAKCPQKIPIPDALRKVLAELDASYDGFGATPVVHGAREESLKAALVVRNLRPAPLAGEVTVEAARGCRFVPASFPTGAVEPLGSKTVQALVTVPDGVGMLEGACRVSAGGEERTSPFAIPFFLAPAGGWRRHEAVLLPEDFARPELARTHGYAVSLSHDDEALHVRVAVRSALEGLARPGDLHGARLELYVDMRGSRGAANAYEEGVEQFFVWLSAPAAKARSERPIDLAPRLTRTAEGVEVALRLPFASFRPAGAPVPSEIGLDWMFVVADAAGADVGHPTYGRRQGLWQSPRLFARAYLL